MPKSTPEKVRLEALLAREFAASLDEALEADAQKAWDAEIMRRLGEIDAGTARLLDREEFTSRMRDRVQRPEK